jgi:putative copper export protein
VALPPDSSTVAALAGATTAVRLSLHVTAAAVWVGGQLTVAGLLPTVRRLGAGAPRAVARAFGRIEWPAYLVLLGTGVWNIAATSTGQSSTWRAVLVAKVAVVVLAGAAAFAHQRARSRAALGAYGALTALASLAALVLGVVLAG